MEDEEIVALYKIGKSIDFITDKYYNRLNSNVQQKYYNNGIFIQNKNITKKEARYRVEKAILDYVRKLFKGTKK